ALDRSLTSRYGIRRYGFHGTSVSWVSRRAAALLGRPIAELAMIALPLGNGASATAVEGGRSVETSLGLTPLEGLVMGTRTGDIGPAVAFLLGREAGMAPAGVRQLCHQRSGPPGRGGDDARRAVVRRAASGDPEAVIGVDVYCHRIRKYVGAYFAVMDRLDAVVFTAGVGEHSALVRAESLAGLAALGIAVDPQANDSGTGGRLISPDGAAGAVCVVPT